MRDHRKRVFKAGLKLEEAVSDGLDALGIPHRRTPHYGREDVCDQLDFVVGRGGGRSSLEIQLTLKSKSGPKLRAFAYRALTTATRGIRLYVEVVGSHRRADLTVVGRRVAEAIKLIVRRFRDYGVYNLLGVRIHAVTAKIEKFDLLEFCGAHLLRLVEQWREERRQERARATQSRQTARASRPPPFWRTLGNALAPTTNPRPISPWRPPHADTRSLFVPRRHCAN